MARKRHKEEKKVKASLDGMIKILGMPFSYTSDFFKKMFKK